MSNNSDLDIASDWLSTEALMADGGKDEVFLALSMVSNAWLLLSEIEKDSSMDQCHVLNLCELGYNGAVWGELGQAVVDVSGLILARYISEDSDNERLLQEGLR